MKRILLVVLTALVALSLLAGCASKSDSYDSNSGYYGEGEVAGAPPMEAPAEAPAVEEPAYDEGASDGVAEEPAAPQEGTGSGVDYDSSVLQPGVDRKIIFFGTIEARTKNYDKDLQSILSKLDEYGGYQQDASESGTKPEDWQDSGRTAMMTLRVPSKHFDAFMNVLKGLGETVSTSVRGEDVSVQYFDTETKLKTLRIRETRLQDLLKEAKGLEDIIELERELANVSYEIQTLETNLRDYDSLIDFSTVTITLYEVHEVQSVEPSEESLGNRISTAFYSVLNALSDFGEGLLIFLIGGAPILVPLALIAVIVIVLVRRHNKKKTNRNNNLPPAA